MQYTAVIRTLGTAGAKYQTLLDSLVSQTLPPEEILVYIAEGYEIPSDTVGTEKYIFVKKGMVAQRALRYDEVKTEYILFLDDDLYFPPDAVEKMFSLLGRYGADVISPDVFHNSERPFKQRFMMAASGRMRARYNDRHTRLCGQQGIPIMLILLKLLTGHKLMRGLVFCAQRNLSCQYDLKKNCGWIDKSILLVRIR